MLQICSTSVFALGLEPVEVITPTGTAVGLASPLGFCYDNFRGLLVVANTEAHRVLILDRGGNGFKVLGTKGDLHLPRAVAVNSAGTLFIALKDHENLQVMEQYDSGTGEEYHELELGAHRRNTAVQPAALHVDRDNNLYVADRGNRQILVFDHNEKFKFLIPDVGEPTDVRTSFGKIYVSDPAFGGVRVYDDKGRWLRTLGTDPAQFRGPLRIKALAVDQRERLWVVTEADQGIKALDSLGNLIVTLPFGPSGPLDIFSAVDLAIDRDNYLYLLERGRNRIRVFRISEF
jgi:DNA-binding beta-propeller fold protein YncE